MIEFFSQGHQNVFMCMCGIRERERMLAIIECRSRVYEYILCYTVNFSVCQKCLKQKCLKQNNLGKPHELVVFKHDAEV